MFVEPPRTEYDFNFHVFGIPVRVSPWFWLVSFLMGMQGADAQAVLIWIVVVFVSILVHELGHAFVIRHFGWTPRIVLYSFGGLAIYDPSFAPWQSGQRARRTGAHQIMISLAGPLAGFLLAAGVIAALVMTNHGFRVPFLGEWIGDNTLEYPMSRVVGDLLWVNIFWGLLNLMPIYPLDGGQVVRELFIANSNDGLRQSLVLSMVTGIGLAVFGFFTLRSLFVAMMFGYLAYSNYLQLNGPFGGGFGSFGGRRPW